MDLNQDIDSTFRLFAPFDHVPLGIFVLDRKYCVIFWNRCLEEWAGIPAKEIVGTDICERFPHFCKKIYADRINGVFEHGPPVIFSSQLHGHIIPSLLDGGGRRFQHTTVTSLPSPDGKEVYALFVLQDVTDVTQLAVEYRKVRDKALAEIEERKIMTAALRENHEKYMTLFHGTLDAVMLLDEYDFFDANPATLKIFGCSTMDEFVGRSPAFFSPEYQPGGQRSDILARRHIEKAMGEGSNFFEWQHKRKDGTEFPAEVLLSAMEIKGKRVLQAVVRDITERKKAEAEIHKLLRGIDQSPASIVITDLDGTIEYVNPVFSEITGYTVAETLGQNPKILKSGIHPQEFYKEMWDTIKSGNVWVGEFCNKKKDGSLFWESANISPIKDSNGNIINFLAVKEDITDKRRLLEEIKRSQEIQVILNRILQISLENISMEETLDRVLHEIIAIPFIKKKEIGCIFLTQANKLKLVSHTGMPVNLLNYYKKRQNEIAFGECLCGKAAQSGKLVFADCLDERHEIYHEGISSHGHYCVPILSKGNVMGVVCLYLEEGHKRDEFEVELLAMISNTLAGIIERKKAQAAVQESERKYREIIDTTREGYWLIDSEKKTLEVNDALCRMLDYRREEMIGRSPLEFVNDVNAKIFREQMAKIPTTLHRTYEITLTRKGGGEVPTIFQATTLMDNERKLTGAFAFITDITKIKKFQKELIIAKEMAEDATHIKDKFVSLVSHDLKGPIAVIRGYLEILKEADFNQKKLIDAIAKEGVDACDHMTSLINDILNLSRVKKGAIKLITENIDVRSMAEDVLNGYRQLAVRKGIELTNDLPEESRIFADKKLVEEVLANLISNAIKFTEKGGRVRLFIPAGEKTTIAVEDTGIGIQEQRMSGLFKSEEKTSTFGTEGEAGTGLGLPLAKEIMTAHGGDLAMESKVGKGTVLYARFPYAGDKK